jgi:hypothetical protein
LYPGRSQGTVFLSRGRAGLPTQRVAGWKRRCCLTHIGVVCDNSELQPRLPQFILGNERTLKARAMVALRAACPPCVVLLRQKSAWSSAAITAAVVRGIGRVLASSSDVVGGAQAVLLLDAARIHFTPVVMAACLECQIVPICVPAKLTWLLQPLDTDAFAAYKAFLKKAYQAARARAPDTGGDVDAEDFLPCVYETIRRVLHGRSWGSAFDRDGYGKLQMSLGSSVRRQLQMPLSDPVGDARPTDDQMRILLPRGSNIPLSPFWRQLDGPPRRRALPASFTPLCQRPPRETSAARGARPNGAHSAPLLLGRTRAQTRLLRIDAAVVSATASSSSRVPSSTTPPPAPPPLIYGGTRSQTRLLRSQADALAIATAARPSGARQRSPSMSMYA